MTAPPADDAAARPETGGGDRSGPRFSAPVRVAASVAGVAAVALLILLATRDTSGGVRADSRLIGELVPPVAGETFRGASFDIDDHRDAFVLVNFFASWCIPCRQEHPELVALDETRTDTRVVSVPFGDTEADARAFFDEYGGDWPVVLDDSAAIAVAFGVLRPPESYLVAPGGTVIAKWQGQITAAEVGGLVDSLLDAS